MRRKQFNFLLLVSVMVALGCQPKSSSENIVPTPVPPAPVTLEKVEQTCLGQLKTRMLKNDLSFMEVSNSELNVEIKNMKVMPLSSAAETTYEIDRDVKSNLNKSIKLSRETKDSNSIAKFESGLSLPQKDATFLYALNLRYSIETAVGTKTVLDQKFRVNSSCQLNLIDTHFTRTTLSNFKLSGISLEEFADGKAGSFRSTQLNVVAPNDGIILPGYDTAKISNWDSIRNFLSSLDKKAFYYVRIESAPYFIKVKMDTGADIEYFDPILGRQTQFHQVIIDFDKFGSSLSGFSMDSGFRFIRIGDRDENWNVNQPFFINAKLSRVDTNPNRIFIASNELLERALPVQAEFLFSSELKYSNVESYWKIESKKEITSASEFKFKYTLQSQKITALDQESAKLVLDKNERSLNPDLQDSTNVQISIAPVQNMIAKLQSHESLNRLEMARLVGKLVTETLTYDYDSLKDSTIHALSTSEILERKKGVCQHFANLFAALARGVGIPTRLITGYFLSSKESTAHAWNEIEIRPGVWVPIEPQNPNLSLNPVFYLPVIAGGYLETMKTDGFQEGIDMGIKFQGKAIQAASGPIQ